MFIKKNSCIRIWLNYLKDKPLYEGIEIDSSFLNGDIGEQEVPNNDVSEEITIDNHLTAQQQSLLWDEDRYLRLAPGENNNPMSFLLDDYAEELSFPGIYLGQSRSFKDGVNITPFQMASSEIRRTDRRGVNPQHLLYMAAKMMRFRVSSSLTIAFKYIGNGARVTKRQIESEDYLNQCMDTNLCFLKSIPNSAFYWSQRKKDVFAMIRQLGRPTIFLTMSANEIGWAQLLQLLQKLKNGVILTKESALEMSWLEKCTLVNNDAVSCAIHFDKLVNTLLSILQSSNISPFSPYKVNNFFKRIEFQHRGSPHAHILLWLHNAPLQPLNEHRAQAISLIDSLISISSAESSGNIKLQTHKHTFTCYKNIRSNHPEKCRFDAPFLPCRTTQILIPMAKEEVGFKNYLKRYEKMKFEYEHKSYTDIDDFYTQNNIVSDDDYLQILRSGIHRPRVFLKRQPNEKWINPFNPFVFHHLIANMDIQFILDEYSCATYVVDYVNKSKRGISDLQQKLNEIVERFPDFELIDITRKMSIDFLNAVELSSQEAAWWLLRKPMSVASATIVFIPTSWPQDRQRFKKVQSELDQLNDDDTNVWKFNIIEKYERRPHEMVDVTLAQFCAQYTCNQTGEYKQLSKQRIIRYVNYDITKQFNDYKREMVLLHIPFRNEEADILGNSAFLQIYTDNQQIILDRRKEFESNINIEQTIRLCEQLCREREMGELNSENTNNVNDRAEIPEPPPFHQLNADPNSIINDDLRLSTLSRLQTIAKRKENLMPNERFCDMMRLTNTRQRSLLLDILHHLTTQQQHSLMLFLTGPAGCGKTFLIHLIMHLYNKYATTSTHCNAYITCASTGKAAVAINGTTVHTAFSLSTGVDNGLSDEVLHQFRSLFQNVKLIIIDEISMIGSEMLERVNKRLKLITGRHDITFGGLDAILVGDLRQLPPVKSTPIFRQSKHFLGVQTWRSFKIYELNEVMRQSNIVFSSILTKIGNGDILTAPELSLIESRFLTEETAESLCPHGIRLAYSNKIVERYNSYSLGKQESQIISTAIDFIYGYQDNEQRNSAQRALDKKKLATETGGLLKSLIFVCGQHYIITTNIDVSDGLANGAIGKLSHIEQNSNNEVTRVWLVFPTSEQKLGTKARIAARAYIIANNIDRSAVPICRRNATIYLNRIRTLSAKRNHFPLAPACALTIHKSQGGTFDEVVYYYEKGQSQQLVYVAMSRATSLEGLHIISVDKKNKFYHGRGTTDPSSIVLRNEMTRLRLDPYITSEQRLFDTINDEIRLSVISFNCQSLNAHINDFTDRIIQSANILMLSETLIDDHEPPPIISNFTCITNVRRANYRNCGTAIYSKQCDKYVTIPRSSLRVNNETIISDRIGDLCAVECSLKENSLRKVILISVYISPNSSIHNIKLFFAKNLLQYTTAGNRALSQIMQQSIPNTEKFIILAGDFNINFSLPSAKPFIDFLQNQFSLHIINSTSTPTTKGGTTIDAVFSTEPQNIQIHNLTTYFSYHNPILSLINL